MHCRGQIVAYVEQHMIEDDTISLVQRILLLAVVTNNESYPTYMLTNTFTLNWFVAIFAIYKHIKSELSFSLWSHTCKRYSNPKCFPAPIPILCHFSRVLISLKRQFLCLFVCLFAIPRQLWVLYLILSSVLFSLLLTLFLQLFIVVCIFFECRMTSFT